MSVKRVLNEIPNEYKPQTLNTPITFGVGGTIQQIYPTYPLTGKGTIYKDDKCVSVDAEVVAMLKAILFAGCCRIEERAKACKTVFDQCLHSIDRESFMAKFDDSIEDPFVQDIYRAIREVWQ